MPEPDTTALESAISFERHQLDAWLSDAYLDASERYFGERDASSFN